MERLEPWISIIIPSYNRAQLLKRAIQSVLNQSESGWELFIVDDCSTDDAWQVAQQAARVNHKISVIQNRFRLGLSGNFSYCSTLGVAPYLLLLAADDWLDEQFLNVVKHIIEQDPQLGLICGRRVHYLSRWKIYRYYATPLKGRFEPGKTAARAIANGNLYGLYSSVVVRRTALVAIGGIRHDNAWAGDFEAWVKIAARYPHYFSGKALVYQHVDNSTQTWQYLSSGQFVRYEAETLRRLLSDDYVINNLTPEEIRNAWYRIHALKILAYGSQRVLRNHNRQAPVPIDMLQSSPRPSFARLTLKMLSLIYQRSRLTY
jgi:glycosyltransferase involved in cell wall biosynthesis